MKNIFTLLALSFCIIIKAQIITTVAGTGPTGFSSGGYSGDGGQADTAVFNDPCDVAFDSHGNMYIADNNNSKIRKVNTAGIISTLPGNYGNPWGLTFDASDNLYIADWDAGEVLKLDPLGNITVVASGLYTPSKVALDGLGNIYVTETWKNRVSKINPPGTITPVAGIGPSGSAGTSSGDGGPAIAAGLTLPMGIAFDANNNLYITDRVGSIRMVNSAGIINTVVGGGNGGLGDGGQATNAELVTPFGITFDVLGNLYIADYSGYRIRKVNTLGIITTVAGNGFNSGIGPGGFFGDGGLATNAELYNPSRVAFDASGNMYIADEFDNRIRKVSLPLTITVNSSTICAGSTTTLTANGANTYVWSPKTGLNDTTGSVVIANPTVTTTYTVIGTKGDSVGLAISIVTVPAVIVNSPSICIGDSTTIIAGGGVTTCTWSSNAGSVNTNTIQVLPTSNTTYTVIGIVGGCTDTAISTVTVNSIPTLTMISTFSVICSGDSVNLIASGATTYTWMPSSNMNIDTGASVTSYPLNTTIFTVSTNNGGCIRSAQAAITVNLLPNVSFTLVQDTAPHTWNTYPSYSTNVASAVWYWGDSTSTSGLYPSHMYSVAGKYNICVAVTDTAGCTATSCLNDSVYRLSNNSTYSNMVYINVMNGNQPMGINQLSLNNNQAIIYPNPTNNSFIIETTNIEKQTIQVFDVNGKMVLTQFINGKTSLDVTNLSKGVYNLSIINSTGVVNKRLVIVR
jgi:hypothetical protein